MNVLIMHIHMTVTVLNKYKQDLNLNKTIGIVILYLHNGPSSLMLGL